MKKEKLKPTQIHERKSLKPTCLIKKNNCNINNRINLVENIDDQDIVEFKNSENKLLEEHNYRYLEI